MSAKVGEDVTQIVLKSIICVGAGLRQKNQSIPLQMTDRLEGSHVSLQPYFSHAVPAFKIVIAFRSLGQL